MKRHKLALRCILVFISTVAVFFLYCIISWRTGHYLPWSSVPSGVRSESELVDYCIDKITKPLKLVFPDEVIKIDTKELLDVTAEVQSIDFFDFLEGIRPEVTCTWNYNDSSIDKVLESNYEECRNAYIKKTGNGFELVKEDAGRDYEIDEVRPYILESIKKKNFEVEMKRFLKEPTVVSSDLRETYDNISWVNDWSINYDSGVVLNAKDIEDCWTDTYDFNIESLNFDNILNKLEIAYNTPMKDLDFTSSDGEKLQVPYVTFGVKVNRDKEKDFILESLVNKTAVEDRHPCVYGYDSFDKTYIEVSLEDQHVWHYKDGSLCCETDCVTGTYGKHDTPTGVFYVSERISGKYLEGEGYKTWVYKWMRLTNQGVGLHDAYWRGRFGKDVYKYKGSHGCINLPSDYAYALFDEIYAGIPVVIY